MNKRGYKGDQPEFVSDEEKLEAQKQLVEKLKVQWKLMWSERFDDKVRAEGVSVSDYSGLRVERGTIIHASRDFKALNFRDILEEHLEENADRLVQPTADVGGWGKFIKTEITGPKSKRKGKRVSSDCSGVADKRESRQVKKSGRGWLHSR